MIRYLRYTAPGFVYSAGITAANGVAALASLRLMREEPWRVRKLQENAQNVPRRTGRTWRRHGARPRVALGSSPPSRATRCTRSMLSQRLKQQGINVQPIVYPAVADDAARLRFFLSSTHSAEQLVHTAERVAVTLAEIRAEFPV